MENMIDSPGGGYILPDGTSVALENVEEMHRAFATTYQDDPDALAGFLCQCALEIHEAGLPGLAPDYLDRALAAGGSEEATSYALLRTGVGFENLKDLQAAAECYGRAMHFPERDPYTWYYLHNNLGYCLGNLGRFAEALPHCLAAIRIAPGRYNAFKNLGIALQGLGRVTEAAGCFRHAYALNPEDERARQHLADLLFEGRTGDVPDLYFRERFFRVAKSRVEEMVREDGASVGGNHAPLENYDAMYLALAESFGDRSDMICMALGILAWYYTLAEIPFEVSRAVNRIENSGSPIEAADALTRLADNLAAIGHPEEAMKCFARAEELFGPNDHYSLLDYHNRLGWCLARLGRHSEADPHFRAAIRLNPWPASSHYGLGITLLAQGDTAAEREMLTADALAPDSPRKRLTQGVE